MLWKTLEKVEKMLKVIIKVNWSLAFQISIYWFCVIEGVNCSFQAKLGMGGGVHWSVNYSGFLVGLLQNVTQILIGLYKPAVHINNLQKG